MGLGNLNWIIQTPLAKRAKMVTCTEVEKDKGHEPKKRLLNDEPSSAKLVPKKLRASEKSGNAGGAKKDAPATVACAKPAAKRR